MLLQPWRGFVCVLFYVAADNGRNRAKSKTPGKMMLPPVVVVAAAGKRHLIFHLSAA
jgi:hypothetical protein